MNIFFENKIENELNLKKNNSNFFKESKIKFYFWNDENNNNKIKTYYAKALYFIEADYFVEYFLF